MSYKITSLGVQIAKLEANPINNTTHSPHSKTFGMLFTYTQSNGFHWMGWRLFIIRESSLGKPRPPVCRFDLPLLLASLQLWSHC